MKSVNRRFLKLSIMIGSTVSVLSLMMIACGQDQQENSGDSEVLATGPGPFNQQCLDMANNIDRAVQNAEMENRANLGGAPRSVTPTQDRRIPSSTAQQRPTPAQPVCPPLPSGPNNGFSRSRYGGTGTAAGAATPQPPAPASAPAPAPAPPPASIAAPANSTNTGAPIVLQHCTSADFGQYTGNCQRRGPITNSQME